MSIGLGINTVTRRLVCRDSQENKSGKTRFSSLAKLARLEEITFQISTNMEYIFTGAIEALLNADKLHRVYSATGQLLPLVRDPNTGRFVEIAVGAVVNNSPVQTLVAPVQLVTGAAQMYQNHRGFTAVLSGLNSIQSSLGVLQATTAVIGIGVAAGVALSAVNLYQTMKLKKAVERLEVKVDNGFIDLKQALRDQGAEVRQLIEQVAQDIKFEQHRLVLVRAYGLFTQAL